MTKIFFPKEAVVKVCTAGQVSISAGAVLDTAFAAATAMTAQIKDLSITLSIGDVDKVDFMGVTSGFQNAEIQENPAGLCEISGTIVVPGDELSESVIFGTGTAAGGTHTTYQPGLATRPKIAMMMNVDDGTDEVNFAVTDARLTEYSPSMGSDNHMEAKITLKCLPKDAYGPQFKN